MSKPAKASTKPTETAPAAQSFLPWPTHEKDLSQTPRLFRIQRVSTYEWQAYVTEGNHEFPMGKPDIFEIIKTKATNIMRLEGQLKFLEDKKKVDNKHVQ